MDKFSFGVSWFVSDKSNARNKKTRPKNVRKYNKRVRRKRFVSSRGRKRSQQENRLRKLLKDRSLILS